MQSQQETYDKTICDKNTRFRNVNQHPKENWHDHTNSDPRQHCDTNEVHRSYGALQWKENGTQHSSNKDSVEYDQHNAEPDGVGVLQIYKRRWYILFVFFLLTITQASIWNQFGPISKSLEMAFSWDKTIVPWMLNIGVIAYVILMVPFAWLMDRKGLRISCLVAGVMVFVGAGFRCITMSPPNVTWLMFVGCCLSGAAGPVTNAAGPLLSSVWFPPHQRTTATAIATLSVWLGQSLSFITGPLLVPEPGNTTNNGTVNISSTPSYWMTGDNNSDVSVDDMRWYIHRYFYIVFGLTVGIFLLILVYFPSHPPSAPSVTATIERTDFKEGLKTLLKNVKFWMIMVTFGVSTSAQQIFTALLNDILTPLDVDQVDAGWIGFYSMLAFIPSGLLVSRFADVFSRKMKLYLTIMYIGCSGFYIWSALMIAQVIPHTLGLLYVSIIGGGLFMGAAFPLFFELSCEMNYPVAEGITAGILTISNNVAGLILLGVQGIPNAANDYSWWGWCLAAATVACIPVFLMITDKYNRMEIDEGGPSEKPANLDIEVPHVTELSNEHFVSTSDKVKILEN